MPNVNRVFFFLANVDLVPEKKSYFFSADASSSMKHVSFLANCQIFPHTHTHTCISYLLGSFSQDMQLEEHDLLP